jgi:hypothetical protein
MLPPDSRQRAESFKRLSAERKEAIISHVEHALPAQRSSVLKTIISSGGSEAEFVNHLLSKPAAAKGESPSNKSVAAPQTK